MHASGIWHLDVALSSNAPAWSDEPLTRYHLVMPPCTPLTIGRPSKAINAQADLVVNDDPSLSKIHASVMRAEDNKLIITELSRFGSWVDGVKMQENVLLPLSEGSVIKLAGKVHMRVGFTPILPLCPTSISQTLELGLKSRGIQISSEWNDSVTHLVNSSTNASICHGSEDLLRALLTSIPIVNESWLTELLSLIDHKTRSSLPSTSSHCPSLVAFDDTCGHPIPFSSLCPSPSLLSGLSIIFVNGFNDPGIEWCIKSCGARLVNTLPSSGHHSPCFNPSILAVSHAMTFSFTDLASRMAMAHMPPVELLSCLITGDKALITQRIMNARMLAEADERSRLAAEMAVDDITDDPADGTPAPLAELVARVEGRSDLLAPPERSMTHRQGRGEHLESPNLSNMVLPSSPTSGGVPLSAERNVQPPRQLGLGPRGLGIGAVRVDEGIFGPPPKISITNMAEMIDRHQLRSFSTTHQQATAPPAPQAPPAPPAPQPQTSSGGKQGSKGRKGSKGKATGKERPPPPQPPAFDAPQGPQETKGPETETVGPGHLIVYLPLVQVNQQSKAKDSNVGEQASGANFKIFKKGGSVSSDRVPQASKVLPMVIVEGRVTKNEAGDAILRAETKRMEAKRKADALFGGDDEDGGGGSRAVEKRRRR